MKEIAQEINNKNITKVDNKFFVNGKETDITIITMLLQSNNKLKTFSEIKLQELIEDHFSETVFEVSDDKIVKESMGKVELTLNDLGEFTPDDKTNLSEYFRWCKTQDGQVIYHVVKNNLFYKIPQTLAGKFLLREVLEYTDLHNELLVSFENLLRSWKKTMIEIANRNFDELDAWIYQNIPQIILQNFDVSLRYKEVNNNERKMRFYQYVEITKNQKNITFLEYIEELFETYGTAVIKQSQEPKLYANSLETPTYHFFDTKPFEISDKVELSESWKEALSKYDQDEQDILLAWIWGVFYEPNKTRAAMYNYDPDGYSGKSAMVNALSDILGKQCVAYLQKDSLNNQFSMAKLWDKRLTIFGDSKDQRIIQRDKIHILLGGDSADVEEKGQKSFSKKMSSKLWINSNVLPIFNSDATHEDSRIIIIQSKMSEMVLKKLALKDENGNIMKDSYGKLIMLGDPNFTQNLCITSATMLPNAYQAYKRLCPTNADFIIPESVRQNNRNIQPVETEIFETIFENLIVLDSDEFLLSSELYKHFLRFTSNNEEFKSLGNSRDFSEFVSQYIEKNRKFKKVETKIDGKRVRGYRGIRLKNDKETLQEIGITISDEALTRSTGNFFKKLGGIE